MVRIIRLDDALSGILELEVSPVEGEQLRQKGKYRRKKKEEKKLLKSEDVGPFVVPQNSDLCA